MDSTGGITAADRLGIDLARSENRLIRQLIDVRYKSGLRPADLARKMGVDRSVVTRFEAGGTNPTMATINRYAEAVGAMIHYNVTRRADTDSSSVARPGTKRPSPGKWESASVPVQIVEVQEFFTAFGQPDPRQQNPLFPLVESA